MNSTRKMSDCITVTKNDHNSMDTVQCIQFLSGKRSSVFATGSWDGYLRIYKAIEENRRAILSLELELPIKEPILSVEWLTNTEMAICAADGNVYFVNLQNQQIDILFKLETPVLFSRYLSIGDNSILLVVTIGDEILMLDLKSGKGFSRVQLPAQPTTAHLGDSLLVIGLSNNKYAITTLEDVGKGNKPEYIDNPLNSPLSVVSVHKNDRFFLIGSVDGRCNLNSIRGMKRSGEFDIESVIVFRAHSTQTSQYSNYSEGGYGKVLHSMNSASFSNQDDNYSDFCFVSGGSEGDIIFWDSNKDVRAHSFKIENNEDEGAITALDINDDGTCIAFATGYDWAKGVWGLEKGKTQPNIYVLDLDVSYFKGKTTTYRQLIYQLIFLL